MLSKELNMQISGWHLMQKSNIFQPSDFQVWSMVPEGHKSSQKHQVGFSSFEQSLETRANCHHDGAFFRNRFVAHQTAVGPTLTIIKGCVGPTKCKWWVTRTWSLKFHFTASSASHSAPCTQTPNLCCYWSFSTLVEVLLFLQFYLNCHC